MPTPAPLPRVLWEPLLVSALREDLGQAGDLTTDAIVPADRRALALLVAREAGCVAGLEIALQTFALLDARCTWTLLAADGDEVAAGATLARLEGPARALLSAERVALNLLGRLCGIATTTRDMVRRVEGSGARIACTRKTTPGLRALEKYAVRCGGGGNHRFGLGDAILIKDNHVALAGGVVEAVRRARAASGHMVRLELEVDTLAQLEAVLDLDIDVVLLDNMSPDELCAAVALAGGRFVLEASGGIRPETARAIAETGVDVLSAGWLTHSSPSLDVALDVDLSAG